MLRLGRLARGGPGGPQVKSACRPLALRVVSIAVAAPGAQAAQGASRDA